MTTFPTQYDDDKHPDEEKWEETGDDSDQADPDR